DLLSEAQREYACLQEEEAALDGAPLPAIPPEAVWGHAFTQSAANGAPLDKLIRCQNTVTRDFYRALRELQRLQSTRPAVNWEHQTDEIRPVVQNEPIPPSSFRLQPSKNEPIPPSSFSLQPSKNEPIPITRAQALAQRRAKLLRYYPPELADAIIAGEQAVKR
ncbi:MAG: hypothetical protein ACYC7E_12835, partial [Armatimonadota bacterium]